MNKIFHTFVAESEDALDKMIKLYCEKKCLKEIERSAPSISIAFKQGVETALVKIAVTSMFVSKTKD